MSDFRIGFLPLVDAALPIIALEFGLAAREGISIELHKDRTWAAVRDRLSYGQTDAAHMLAPLALAMALGLDRPPVPIGAPFMLGLNGNAFAISAALAAGHSLRFGPDIAETGRKLADIARARMSQGHKLRIGVVHRYSSHNYILRYWLAACGCDPDRSRGVGRSRRHNAGQQQEQEPAVHRRPLHDRHCVNAESAGSRPSALASPDCRSPVCGAAAPPGCSAAWAIRPCHTARWSYS